MTPEQEAYYEALVAEAACLPRIVKPVRPKPEEPMVRLLHWIEGEIAHREQERPYRRPSKVRGTIKGLQLVRDRIVLERRRAKRSG